MWEGGYAGREHKPNGGDSPCFSPIQIPFNCMFHKAPQALVFAE